MRASFSSSTSLVLFGEGKGSGVVSRSRRSANVRLFRETTPDPLTLPNERPFLVAAKAALRNQFADDISRNVGEPIVAAFVTVRELFVIDA